jgi:hypothetical protein
MSNRPPAIERHTNRIIKRAIKDAKRDARRQLKRTPAVEQFPSLWPDAPEPLAGVARTLSRIGNAPPERQP